MNIWEDYPLEVLPSNPLSIWFRICIKTNSRGTIRSKFVILLIERKDSLNPGFISLTLLRLINPTLRTQDIDRRIITFTAEMHYNDWYKLQYWWYELQQWHSVASETFTQ